MKSLINILRLFKPYKKTALLITIFVVFNQFIYMINPLISKYVVEHVNDMTYGEGLRMIYCVSILYIIIFLMDGVTRYIDIVGTSLIWDDAKQHMHSKVFEKFMRLPFSWHDDNCTGEIISLVDRDVEMSCELLVMLPTTILKNILGVLVGIALFFYIDPILMGYLSPLIILLILFEIVISPKLKRTQKEWRKMQRKYIGLISDLLSGYQTVIGFGREEHEKKKIFDSYQKIREIAMRKYHEGFLNGEGIHGLATIFYSSIIVIGTYQTISHHGNPINFMIFYMYAHYFINPLTSLASHIRYYHESMEAFERVQEFLNLEEGIQTPCYPIVIDNPQGEIRFEHVTFGYIAHTPILDDISFTIRPGEYIALVGLSGVGKSTIGRLIPRFYDVNKGAIFLDGIDIRELSLKQLRSLVGNVSQDVYLFNGTIIDNIRYGNLDATEEDIVRVSKLANIYEFIQSTENGYLTEIGEHGIKLSGGQKQRIAIARLLLADPKVMVFDEATSSLDECSQKEIQTTLDNISGTKTMIVIAHRLSTIRNADRILCLTEDGIVEEGTHVDLLQKKGCYSKMYQETLTI